MTYANLTIQTWRCPVRIVEKVFKPIICSRIEKSDVFTCGFCNRTDICSLVPIAVGTSKRKIAFHRSAIVLFGDDVIDLTSVESIRFLMRQYSHLPAARSITRRRRSEEM
jgi:hypothetical protein